MKISTSWLREFVKIKSSAGDIARHLSFAGIEVAAVTPALGDFDKVLVGQVTSVAPHPDAAKLKICQVDTGSGSRQIVCGAANVVTGMKAPVILPGGKLPDGTEIEQTQLRGVESDGMLCSARELGLSEEHSGLLTLPADAKVGQDLRQTLGGDDEIIEIEITPNRGDCLSIAGVAREVSTLFDVPLLHSDLNAVPTTLNDSLSVELKVPSACPIYGGRVIRNIKSDAVTPLWMRERLRRAGIRPISPAVDVTQYVMLELGHPMHAYDMAQIDGGIVVRWAETGESVRLLDGNEHSLIEDILVIADKRRVLGVAGIMGGAESSVQPTTRDVFLECAYFTPAVVSGRSRRLGLITDAGYRFERGVDPLGQKQALERATQLLVDIAGGEAGPVKVTEDAKYRPAHKSVHLRRTRLDALLGISVPDAEVNRILIGLGFKVTKTKDGWGTTAPSHRFDIEIEEDLIEEVGRTHGYEHIPALQYPARHGMDRLPEDRVDLRRLRQVLVARGYQESITYSFVDEALNHLCYGTGGLPLANPITADMTEMRLGLWPGLLKVLQYNLNRQQERVRIFETGFRFTLQHYEIKQENTIAGLLFGPEFPLQWGIASKPADFADLKSHVEGLVALGGAGKVLKAEAASHPALHPGQAARLMLNGYVLGWMGALHPRVLKALELPPGVLVFELALKPLLEGKLPRFTPISRFPHIRRDLAVVVAEQVTAEQLLEVAREVGGSLVQEAWIFDIYRGAGIDSGRKSVALGLILQDSSRTLTDEEADGAMQRVAEALKQNLGATIRD